MSTATTRSATQPSPTAPPAPDVVPVPRTGVTERGSFAHAYCQSCGWRGPGRRARATCEHDAGLHRLTGCGL